MPKGQATCACLGSKSSKGVKEFDCNATAYPWGVDGRCVNATAAPVPGPYPADYGDSCKKHLEPGTSDCFDLDKTPPEEKPVAEQKSWCTDPWCYVDECNCDASDATWSFWFKPVKIAYSYATCGASDKFTTNQEGGVVGNTECDASAKAADAAADASAEAAATTGDTTGGTTATTTAAAVPPAVAAQADGAQMLGTTFVATFMLLAMLFAWQQ
jgi:hypothetical protein